MNQSAAARCPVSIQLAGFAINLATDGVDANSQCSWHLQMVLPGRRDRADLWTCWDRHAGSPTVTHCPSPSARVLRVHASESSTVSIKSTQTRRPVTEHWHVHRSLRTGPPHDVDTSR